MNMEQGQEEKVKAARKKDELICHICQGSHLTKNCPHREELRSFAPEGSSEEVMKNKSNEI